MCTNRNKFDGNVSYFTALWVKYMIVLGYWIKEYNERRHK